MKTRKLLAIVLSLVMVFSLCSNALAAHLTDEVTELETENSELSMEMATQGMALLENMGDVLPFKEVGKIAIFGGGAEYTIKGGSGSGDVNQRTRDNIDEAFEAAGWEITNKTWLAKMDDVAVTGGCMGGGVKADQPITDEELEEAKAADTALYVISRTAGEFQDRAIPEAPGDGDFYLSEQELENLTKITENFENVVVIINATVIDTSFYRELENIDALVYMLQGGQRGSEALVKLLMGEMDFSGRLTDTFPISYEDYPSAGTFSSDDGNTNTEWYNDGIYVGYRYFDTFGINVAYPFGYGLSYNYYEIEPLGTSLDGTTFTVDVKVTNLGDIKGREVIQVYFSAPQGELEVPYQELIAYGKTDELQPKDAQTLHISFDVTEMSSYSEERAADILQPGDYIIRVGTNSRSTSALAVITVDDTIITQQYTNQFALENGAELNLLSNEGAEHIRNMDEYQLDNADKYELTAADVTTVYTDEPNDDETITTYLFADDAEGYEARDTITLKTKTVAGIIENAEDPTGADNKFNGYSTTTYKEVVEVVEPLPEGITKENAKLTDVYEDKITMDQFLACLSMEELSRIAIGGASGSDAPADGEAYIGAQASAVQGGAGQTTDQYYFTRFIPAMPNADGPAGIRITQHYTKDDQDYYQFCTAFPAGNLMAMTWDTDLIYKEGQAIGKEMVEYGVTTWLAPGMNIHRNAICGRNFEYYSEDPLVTGLSAASVTMGIQSNPGIGVTLKHCWGNNQENNRNSVDNVISERAAREIYLKGFGIAVMLAQPMCIMNSYNENNGWPASDSWDLNEDYLRYECGFKGAVMTDWGGGQSTPLISMHAGCDMIMSGGNAKLKAVREGYGFEPVFAQNGSISDAGLFVPAADGEKTYTVTAVIPGNPAQPVNTKDQLPESVQEGIDAGYIDFVPATEEASATLTYHGNLDYSQKNELVNRICLGDFQKAARHILENALVSQDMVKLYKDLLDEDIEGTFISEAREAKAATGEFKMVEKDEITSYKGTITATNEFIDITEGKDEAEVTVVLKTDELVSSVRMYFRCDLPVKEIKSDYTYEYNPDADMIVIYTDGGEVLNGNEDLDFVPLFTIVFDVTDAELGIHDVALELIQATDDTPAFIDLLTEDGVVYIYDGSEPPVLYGDVDRDGDVDNADVIMIARYLVDLQEFDDEQMILADFDQNDEIDNVDLVLIVRYVIEN